MGRLDGKVAFISGGARGMGAAEARLFAKEGAKVAIGDVLDDQGRVHLDVTSEANWHEAVAVTTSRFGGLHVLVNNAGISVVSSLVEETSEADWDRVMDINAKGVFLGTKVAIPEMRNSGGGSIINISSQYGLVGAIDSTPQYQASKGAVRTLTKLTALQYAKEGIRVNSVHPGPIATPMNERRRSDPNAYQSMLSRVPLGRFGQPDDVGYAVLYLASDESRFVTGSELVVDGGWVAQ